MKARFNLYVAFSLMVIKLNTEVMYVNIPKCYIQNNVCMLITSIGTLQQCSIIVPGGKNQYKW
jgi:hypothetical protein